MDWTPLGEVKPTPGTPLKLSVNFPEYDKEMTNTIYVQVLPGNIGDVYIGRENLNVATKTGIVSRLRPPTDNHLPDVALNMPVIRVANPFNVDAYRIDVDNLGDGVIVTIGGA